MSSLRIIPAAIASCFSLVTLSYFFFVSLPFHIEQYRLSKRIAHHREQKAREEELAAKECVSGYPVIQGLETLAPQDVSDVALPVSENRDGIVFHETTAVTSTETSKMAPLLESVQDRADTMDIFKIPVRVASGVWTTSQTPNTVLYEINYNTAHLSCNRWAEIFNKYTFYRYRVRVRVELDGTPFHQGKLLLYYHPGFTVPTGVFASLDNITSLEHRSIYPAYNNVQELKMPWQYHFDYARVNPTSTFSSFLRLAVFNQLQAGTGAVTSLNWSVYLTLEDVELKVPVPITLPAALLGVEPFEEIKPFAYDSTPIPVVQGLLNFTTINNQFSNITDSTLPTNVTGDKFDTEVNASGMMDNPNWTANAPAAKVRVLDSMSNTKGPVVNYRMALDPSKMMDPGPELFDCTNDEMDLTDLTSRWSLVNSQSRGITFGATDQAGKVLFQTYLNPGVLGGAVDNSAAPAPVYRNLLCYLAQRFQRWHGGIKFCVEIIATQYQTGKLFLGFSPGYVDVVSNTPGGADILTNYGKVIEVNKGRNLYEIEIPWYYLTEWASTVYTLSQTNSITYDLYGKFYVAVVNPLAVPAGTPSTIAFNVYVAGAEDFRFSFPVGTTTSAQIQGANTIGRFGGRTKGVDNIHDIPRSLRDIVRRPQYYTGFDLTFLENAPVKYAIVPLDWIMAGYYDETLLNNTRRSGTLGYFGALYRGYTGDLRIKALVTRTTTGTSVDQNLPASNKYPLHVAHFPTLPQKNNTTPTNNEVVRGIQLWLKARYLQSSAGTILKTPPNDIATAAWGTTGISAPGYANAPAMFEETIIDPIQSLELEIPMNGLAKFSTNDASSGALARGEDAHSKSWGYLVFHQWANHTAGIADTTDFTWVDMYLGAADNFRMGMHIGIPNIVSYNAAAANPFGRFTN